MRKIFGILFIVVVGVVAVWIGVFYWDNLRGIGPAVRSPGEDIADLLPPAGEGEPEAPSADLPLELPNGFSISVFARDLPDARVLVRDGLGNFWVSQPDEGIVSLLTVESGRVSNQQAIFRDLNNPHGLAIDPQDDLTLYIAEEGRIRRFRLYSEDRGETIAELPAGGRHTTRTIAFGPDGRLYVSIGSSCDTCVEDDERRAAVYSMNPDGSDMRRHAEGLRNAVFFTWSPVDGRMWATEMGRDFLGDNLPPDEINIVREGLHYGWPYCYGKQVRDEQFRPGASFDCAMTEPSAIDIQAHSAPLGLAFVPEDPPSHQQRSWPEEMWHDVLVAYHGSWNRTEPTGYKIQRFRLNDQGQLQGREPFVEGWLRGDGTSFGRPVDIHIEPGGVMYITDDKAGVVYRVTYTGNR